MLRQIGMSKRVKGTACPTALCLSNNPRPCGGIVTTRPADEMRRPLVPILETQSFDPQELVGTSPGIAASLLVIHGLSSHRHALPRDGMLIIGRAPEVDIRIDDAAVSR